MGGLNEIGMNCMALEYQDEILVIDCGVMFTDLDAFGISFIVPSFEYLLERKDKIKAFVMTHGHEDHIGAISYALKAGLRAPIYASPFTSNLVKARLLDSGYLDQAEVRTFELGQTLEFKHFKVQTVPVNHSIVESVALIIDTPIGKVVHTGDFKIDTNPYYGKPMDLTPFKKAGDEGVLLLLSDSTNIERLDPGLSEEIVFDRFEELFSTAQGLTVVSMFSSNVGRMGQIFELARKMKKRVAVTGRSMDQVFQVAQESGYLKGAEKVFIPVEEIDSQKRNDLIVLSTGSQGEFRSALFRMGKGENAQIQLEKGDQVIMSSRFIPGNEKAVSRVINNLFKQGAEVFYATSDRVHVSGHASKPELKKMLELTRPKFFIPVHGEYRHLVHHARLARETGVREENAVVAVNADEIEVTASSCTVIKNRDEIGTLVDDGNRSITSRDVLKERRQLAERGAVSFLLLQDSNTKKLLCEPKVQAFGILEESMKEWMLEEAQKIARDVVTHYPERFEEGEYNDPLDETLRIEIRRFFSKNLGKKPVVFPNLIEL